MFTNQRLLNIKTVGVWMPKRNKKAPVSFLVVRHNARTNFLTGA